MRDQENLGLDIPIYLQPSCCQRFGNLCTILRVETLFCLNEW